MSEHTVRSFSQELEEMSGDLARMGGLAEDLLTDALRSLETRDIQLADSVVNRDVQIDALQVEIEKRIFRLLALRQPLAKDLRGVISALKMATEIERIGDLAKNIGKRAKLLDSEPPPGALKGVSRMGRIVIEQLNRVLDAYAASDADSAIRIWRRDEEVDEHYTALFRQTLTYMMEDPRTISPCTHILFVAKNLERIGDHCTNLAEEVHFLVTGESIVSERPKVDVLTGS